MITMKRKISIAIVWMIVSLSLISAVPCTESVEAIGGDDENGNDLDLDLLEVGDILLTRGSMFDKIIPGEWTHAAMYIGDGQLIEAVARGVVIRPIEEIHNNNEVGVFRVSVEDEVKEAAVEFALEQVGKPYNIFLFNKRMHGPSYYCSELVWASYMVNGICIDANPGWSWDYAFAVAPTELAEHPDTAMIMYAD